MKTFSAQPAGLMLALLLSLVAGCGGGSDSVIPEAFAEHDFAADPSLRMAAGEVGVTLLEPKDAAAETSDDTGLLGTDEFPLRIAEQTTFTYAMDTSDDTIAMVRMIRLTGNVEVFVIDAAQPSATVTLEPGDYKLVVYSGYTMAESSGETNRAVFLANNTSTPTPTQAAMNAGTPRKSVLAAATPTQVLFSSKRCIECNLIRANLNRANLTGADLTGADLTGAYLIRANLSGANLSGADLTGAYLHWTKMSHAILKSAMLNKARMYGADLSYADLTRASLVDAGMDRVNLMNAKLLSATLLGASLELARLDRADLSGANMSGMNLSSTTNLSGQAVSGPSLVKANLSGAKLNGAKLSGVGLWGVNLSGADLRGADLTGADLSSWKSSWSAADIKDYNVDMNLTGRDLIGWNLSGADLSHAIWTDLRVCSTPSIGVCN